MSDLILTEDELAQFVTRGYVRIHDALPPGLVARVQDAVWNELKVCGGVLREDPSTWRTDWLGVNKEAIDKASGVYIGPRLVGAVDQLLGAGRWRRLRSLGGLLFTMPSGSCEGWNVAARGWHQDNDSHNYRAELNELMLFTFFSSVGPQGGGTLVLSGSHRLLEQYLVARDAGNVPATVSILDGFADWHPWLAELMGRRPRTCSTDALLGAMTNIYGTCVQVVELTGEPGDAVLCHPAILHAVNRNCSPTPRIMRRTNFRRSR